MWKEQDDDLTCSLCTKYTQRNMDCSKCRKTKSRQCFHTDDLQRLQGDLWCSFCKAKSEEEKRIPGFLVCDVCNKNQPRTNFPQANSKTAECQKIIFKICSTPCTGCGKRRHETEFAERRLRYPASALCVKCAKGKERNWNEQQQHAKANAAQWCEGCKANVPKTAFSTTQLESQASTKMCLSCATKKQTEWNEAQRALRETRVTGLTCTMCDKAVLDIQHMTKGMQQKANQFRRQTYCITCYRKHVIMCVGCSTKKHPATSTMKN